MTRLALRDVSMRYAADGPLAADRVGFEVAAGSLTALVGPSGCGKTTVLHIIAGLLIPEAGQVLIDGRDMTALRTEERPIGMVFQSNALFPHLTVSQNIGFALQAAGRPARQVRREAAQALEKAGLGALADARPMELSGGQQQRVALVRALVHAPSVLLLDEPLSSVDASLRRGLLEELRALKASRDLAIVYVTHDHREALGLSDQIVLLGDGKVAQAGTPHTLYERPTSEFAASFMGEAGIYSGLRDGEGRVSVGPALLGARFEGAAGPVRVAIRPEAWRLGPASATGLPGAVAKRCYLGRGMEYEVETALGPVLVMCRAPLLPLDIGAPVSLHLSAHGASVIKD